MSARATRPARFVVRRLALRRDERLRNPEVRDDGVLATEQDVLRLDVAVDHALLVGIRQGVGDLAQHAHGFAQPDRLAREPGAQGLAGHVGHHIVGAPGQGAGLEDARVEEGEHMRMLETRR